MNTKMNSNKGFTLVELLVCLGIVGILVALVLMQFGSVSQENTVKADNGKDYELFMDINEGVRVKVYRKVNWGERCFVMIDETNRSADIACTQN